MTMRHDDQETNSHGVAGIVLCGGHSQRMGQSKATLPFGDQTMLSRVVQIVATVCSPVVVVASARQPLDDLPKRVMVTHDRRESRGPLEGIAAGMVALNARKESGDASESLSPPVAAYVTGCDVPLLRTEFIRHLLSSLGADDEAAVPRCERFHHPLAGVYRMSALPAIQQMLADDILQASLLVEHLRTREVSTEELQVADPELLSLQNVNTPDQYFAALRQCGIEPDPAIVAQMES